MFEGFIRNGHAGELALDDIRLGNDIPLEYCMGTCSSCWGAGDGVGRQPWRALAHGRLPLLYRWLLDLSWDSANFQRWGGIGPWGTGISDCVGVKGRKHMSLLCRAERAAEGDWGLFYVIRTYAKSKRKVLDKRNQLSVNITCLEEMMSSKGVFFNKK